MVARAEGGARPNHPLPLHSVCRVGLGMTLDSDGLVGVALADPVGWVSGRTVEGDFGAGHFIPCKEHAATCQVPRSPPTHTFSHAPAAPSGAAAHGSHPGG
jgi:hypothetical protein